MRQIFVIACWLLAGPVLAAQSTWLQDQIKNMHLIVGSYVSNDYGFSITPPPRTDVYVSNGGDANHGVVLIIGEGRKIVVYPQYTGLTPGDAEPCRKDQVPWEPANTIATTVLYRRSLNACTITVAEGNTIRRVIKIARNDKKTSIMYTILLTTTKTSASNDYRLLRQVENGFKQISITP